jgi:SAM-dependent methyltransferase
VQLEEAGHLGIRLIEDLGGPVEDPVVERVDVAAHGGHRIGVAEYLLDVEQVEGVSAALGRGAVQDPSRRPAEVVRAHVSQARLLGTKARNRRGIVGQPQDIRLSFNEAADIYNQIRPSYPPEVFDVLFGSLPPTPEIVEVGPGTGQATRDLLAHGATVRAVEIGPMMAARLRANLPSDRLQVIVGDFETVNLTPASADALFSATAYHWISPKGQTERPAAILRPGGLVAIVDLVQVASPTDHGFFAAAQPIYERYGEGHTGPPAPTREEVDPPMRTALDADGRFDTVTLRCYDWDLTYSASDYRKLMVSYSGTQMMEPAARVGLLDDMESFIRSDFDGHVTRPLVVALTMAVFSGR